MERSEMGAAATNMVPRKTPTYGHERYSEENTINENNQEQEWDELNWDDVPIVQAICCTGNPMIWTEGMHREIDWAVRHVLPGDTSSSDTKSGT